MKFLLEPIFVNFFLYSNDQAASGGRGNLCQWSSSIPQYCWGHQFGWDQAKPGLQQSVQPAHHPVPCLWEDVPGPADHMWGSIFKLTGYRSVQELWRVQQLNLEGFGQYDHLPVRSQLCGAEQQRVPNIVDDR